MIRHFRFVRKQTRNFKHKVDNNFSRKFRQPHHFKCLSAKKCKSSLRCRCTWIARFVWSVFQAVQLQLTGLLQRIICTKGKTDFHIGYNPFQECLVEFLISRSHPGMNHLLKVDLRNASHFTENYIKNWTGDMAVRLMHKWCLNIAGWNEVVRISNIKIEGGFVKLIKKRGMWNNRCSKSDSGKLIRANIIGNEVREKILQVGNGFRIVIAGSNFWRQLCNKRGLLGNRKLPETWQGITSM